MCHWSGCTETVGRTLVESNRAQVVACCRASSQVLQTARCPKTLACALSATERTVSVCSFTLASGAGRHLRLSACLIGQARGPTRLTSDMFTPWPRTCKATSQCSYLCGTVSCSQLHGHMHARGRITDPRNIHAPQPGHRSSYRTNNTSCRMRPHMYPHNLSSGAPSADSSQACN